MYRQIAMITWPGGRDGKQKVYDHDFGTYRQNYTQLLNRNE